MESQRHKAADEKPIGDRKPTLGLVWRLLTYCHLKQSKQTDDVSVV